MRSMAAQEGACALIAADDSLVKKMVRGQLEEAGHTVVGQAANRAEAIEPVQSSDPSIVLMDIKMPGAVMRGQAAAGQAQLANLSAIAPRPAP